MKCLSALFLFIPLLASVPTAAQTPASSGADKKAAKQATIKNMMEAQNYIFKAQTALPMGARTRQLTTDYDLRVTKEKIVSYLPYFGRAYSAPIDPTKGGIQFTSKNFDYTLTPGKKDGWTVVIKPKDYGDIQQMTLFVSSDGYASLQVTSINRQPISFNGTVVPPKTK
jgi:uncharacterized protein DUF4251